MSGWARAGDMPLGKARAEAGMFRQTGVMVGRKAQGRWGRLLRQAHGWHCTGQIAGSMIDSQTWEHPG